MLSTNHWCRTLGVCGISHDTLVLELSRLHLKISLDGIIVAVIELAVLNST
jgi:hypothetical protein